MMKLALLVGLNFLGFLPNGCHAFHSLTTSSRRILLTPDLSSTRLQAHPEGHGTIGIGDKIFHSDEVAITRRSIFSSVCTAAALPILTTLVNPSPSFAIAVGSTAQSTARVESYPGIESIEPLYEFKLSIDAIVAGVQDQNNWPFIKKRLEAFFGGFIMNEKNYFMGVGLQYMNDIKYDKNELPNYVLLDKEARFDALDNTMKNLESLKSVLSLATGTTGGNNYASAVEDLAKASQSTLQSFFAMIPEQDVKDVEELFVHVQKADMNGDGKLSNDEILYLSPVEQEIWKRRIGKFG